jgi:membrane fusion protein (multidrug efflux system)
VEAYPGKKFGEGRIVRVSPAVDRNTRTFEVEAEVPNPGRELRPGGFAKADILTRIAPDAIAAPLAAVYAFVGSTRVFVVRDGKAHVVPVTLGAELPRTGLEKSGWVELVDPDPGEIRPGIEVITTAHSRLSEGTPVIVRRVESKQP